MLRQAAMPKHSTSGTAPQRHIRPAHEASTCHGNSSVAESPLSSSVRNPADGHRPSYTAAEWVYRQHGGLHNRAVPKLHNRHGVRRAPSKTKTCGLATCARAYIWTRNNCQPQVTSQALQQEPVFTLRSLLHNSGQSFFLRLCAESRGTTGRTGRAASRGTRTRLWASATCRAGEKPPCSQTPAPWCACSAILSSRAGSAQCIAGRFFEAMSSRSTAARINGELWHRHAGRQLELQEVQKPGLLAVHRSTWASTHRRWPLGCRWCRAIATPCAALPPTTPGCRPSPTHPPWYEMCGLQLHAPLVAVAPLLEDVSLPKRAAAIDGSHLPCDCTCACSLWTTVGACPHPARRSSRPAALASAPLSWR